MFSLAIKNEPFLCLVCGKITDKATFGGVDACENLLIPIEVCPDCGPIDLEAMQLCREIATDCMRN
jgi:hypothetical protein